MDVNSNQDHDQNVKPKRHHLRKIRIKFYIYASSVFVTFGSFVAMNSLQSSINIEEGLGNKTMMTCFGCGILSALFVTPVLIRLLGPRYSLILSDICFLVYVLANIYPSIYTLIPGAVFAGVASATMWPCTSLFNVYFGLEHSSHSKREHNTHVQSYTAYFFGVFQFNQVIGNLFTTITFKLSEARATENEENTSDGSGVTDLYDVTTPSTYRDVSFCGANDCQDPNKTSQNLEQYNPPTNKSLYILVGILSLLIVISIIVKFIFLPKISSTVKLPKSSESSASILKASDVNIVPKLDSSTNMTKMENGGTTNGASFYINSTFESENDLKDKEQNQQKKDVEVSNNQNDSEDSTWTFFLKTVKSTAVHVTSKQQLLVAGLTFYDGMVMSFVMSELTRAYASCVIGIAEVGLGMITYGLGDIIFSFIVGKTPTSGGIYRNIPFFFAFAFDAINYCFCLTWVPNVENSWVIYLFFFGFGSADGIWQTLLNFRYAEYFHKRQDIAFTAWNMWIMLGFFLQYTLSSYMCVYEKIYLHMSLLVVTFVLYGFAEYRFLRISKQNDTTVVEDNSVTIVTKL